MKIDREQIDAGKVPYYLDPLNDDTKGKYFEDAEAIARADMLRKLNDDAKRQLEADRGQGRPTPTVYYRRGVLVLLPDGSAAHVTAAALNRMIAHAPPPSGLMVKDPGPVRLDRWGEDAKMTMPLYEHVPALFYPTKIYGCPVIAVGLRGVEGKE